MSKPNDLEPDPPLSRQEQERLRFLPGETIEAIDAALLDHATTQWRKVAMVVAQTMEALEACMPDIPDIYFAQRVRGLVERGKLDAHGDLSRMRYSEVRLKQGETTRK